MFKHILAPIDGSELSLQAGQRAIELARSFKARLTAVLVCPSFQQFTARGYLVSVIEADRTTWEQGVAARTQATAERFAAQAQSAGVSCGAVIVVDDSPDHAIIDTARVNDCDLIVMGSHGHGGFKQLVLGSVTTRVLSHSKIPVLVYR